MVDEVIFYRVFAIMTEIGLQNPISLIDDFDEQLSVKRFVDHLLMEFHLEIRDDVDDTEFIKEFRTAMQHYNKISNIKADFYEMIVCPGPTRNCHTAYLTVTTI